MPDQDTNAALESWLKDKGYSDEDRQKILAKLAQHDHETLSDAIFDSIGGRGTSLDQIIDELLRN
jgi:hypothetical protein